MKKKEEVISFWNTLYKDKKTPWDQGGVPERLNKFVQTTDKSLKVLIPGCGSAYEAKYLAELGYDVTAIDISCEAIERAKKIVGVQPVVIENRDFFELEEAKFDLIYERAFLCSFDPILRTKFILQCQKLLNNDGCIFGFFFVSQERESGPPFPIAKENLELLMKDKFQLVEDEVNKNGLQVFDGNERWQVWKKTL